MKKWIDLLDCNEINFGTIILHTEMSTHTKFYLYVLYNSEVTAKIIYTF